MKNCEPPKTDAIREVAEILARGLLRWISKNVRTEPEKGSLE